MHVNDPFVLNGKVITAVPPLEFEHNDADVPVLGVCVETAARHPERLVNKYPPRIPEKIVSPPGCSFTPCRSTAVNFIAWGTSPDQRGNVCRQHLEEVWESVKSGVQLGSSFWIQKQVQT